MRTLGITLSIMLVFFVAVSADAQSNRTAVSVRGDDLNNCTLLDPCRSFNRAILMTNPGGEVIALDSGGYGPFTIDKAVSVQAAPGIYAGITVPPSSVGVLVTAAAGDAVEIRGLTIRGLNSAGLSNGIQYNSGSSLHISNCVIGKFYGHGIFADLTANGSIEVADTLIRGVDIGIYFRTSSGTIKGSVVRTRAENVGVGGVYVSDNARVTVSNSVVDGSSVGFRVLLFSGTTGELNIESSIASNNSIGLLLDSSAGTSILRASNMMITNNATGISTSAGGTKQVLSFGNNRLGGNTTPGAFTALLGQQ